MSNVSMEDLTDARLAQLVTTASIGAGEEAKGYGDPVGFYAVRSRIYLKTTLAQLPSQAMPGEAVSQGVDDCVHGR